MECDLSAIAQRLNFADSRREWPQVLQTEDGVQEVESSLTATAAKLRELHQLLESAR